MSRQHARLAVDDSGGVWLSSMGKEAVCVNGQPAHDAVELYSGDQIEVTHQCSCSAAMRPASERCKMPKAPDIYPLLPVKKNAWHEE